MKKERDLSGAIFLLILSIIVMIIGFYQDQSNKKSQHEFIVNTVKELCK